MTELALHSHLISDDALVAGLLRYERTRPPETKRVWTRVVARSATDYRSSCQLEEVTVQDDRGQTESFFLKQNGPTTWLREAKQVRPRFLYHVAREASAYEELLRPADVGAPQLVASSIDRKNCRSWLLLEKVPGHLLSHTGDFGVWRLAARQLAEMHVILTRVWNRSLRRTPLVRYNRSFYETWIDRAEQSLLRGKEPIAGISETNARSILTEGRRTVDVLFSLPQSVIHGESYASNIIVGVGNAEPRICPVDWETCGLGPGLFDLAALVGGAWSAEQIAVLVDEYRDAYDACAENAVRYDFGEALRCCRLHQAIRWIGWCRAWQPPEEHRNDWLNEALTNLPG